MDSIFRPSPAADPEPSPSRHKGRRTQAEAEPPGGTPPPPLQAACAFKGAVSHAEVTSRGSNMHLSFTPTTSAVKRHRQEGGAASDAVQEEPSRFKALRLPTGQRGGCPEPPAPVEADAGAVSIDLTMDSEAEEELEQKLEDKAHHKAVVAGDVLLARNGAWRRLKAEPQELQRTSVVTAAPTDSERAPAAHQMPTAQLEEVVVVPANGIAAVTTLGRARRELRRELQDCKEAATQGRQDAQDVAATLVRALNVLQKKLQEGKTELGATLRELQDHKAASAATAADVQRDRQQAAAQLRASVTALQQVRDAQAATDMDLGTARRELATTRAELGAMRAQLDTARVKLQAAEDRRDSEVMCPVCIEKPKSLALGCGHQMCEGCASQVSACPTCRVTFDRGAIRKLF